MLDANPQPDRNACHPRVTQAIIRIPPMAILERRTSSDKFCFMPKYAVPAKSLEQVACEVDAYALPAYEFIREVLEHTGTKLHGPRKTTRRHRHITGQDLCEGLREVAIERWGMLARTVLERWGIYSTMDVGQIVYALIDAGLMSKSPGDSIDDFRNVYDFRNAFERSFRIELATA
jgi:uncharacterized repeat protein (TIGR04138 family)